MVFYFFYFFILFFFFFFFVSLQDGADLLEKVSTQMSPLLSAVHAPRLLRYGHVTLEQWLSAQFLAVEDSLSDKVIKLAAERFPIFSQASSTVQVLPFIYSPVCAASSLWRGVIHFIGLVTGVYPLSYRLCAWGDNSNIAAYQWLLQLKSQVLKKSVNT